jgi:IS5 family transposase
MNVELIFPEEWTEGPDVRRFMIMREAVLPALEAQRPELESMYSEKLGRPEVDPVLLACITVLQMMERRPDRAAVESCLYDVRWRLALGLPAKWPAFHSTTLVYFRGRLAESGKARLALEAGLEAMRQSGYLKGRRAVRVDSTHVLAQVSAMSRLECVRETLRLALNFLSAFGGSDAWEPWFTRYEDRHPDELRGASADRLRLTMGRAGSDMWDILKRTDELGEIVSGAEPVALLRRVFGEQFEPRQEGGEPVQRKATPTDAVKNPHDPEAVWSTKKSIGKAGWVGYKLQVCETAPEAPRKRGESTEAVITAVVTQPATTSDHGSLAPVLAEHGVVPEEVFADAGYISIPALHEADTQGYELTGPVGAPPHSGSRFGTDSFAVDIPGRKALCPANVLSSECSRINEASRGICYYFAWPRAACSACPLKDRCLSKRRPSALRTLQVGEGHMTIQARRQLCKTPEYRKRMMRRSGIEGTHSELKRGYGLQRCRYKGRAKADLQAQFTAAACNLRRWAARLCWLDRQRS